MNAQTVTMKVPPKAGYLALLRTVVGGCAGREGFTLDQIDDVKMAVDEAAVQLLKHNSGDAIVLNVGADAVAMEVRVTAQTPEGSTVIDRSSFSWTILEALADSLDVQQAETGTTVVLRKERHESVARGET